MFCFSFRVHNFLQLRCVSWDISYTLSDFILAEKIYAHITDKTTSQVNDTHTFHTSRCISPGEQYIEIYRCTVFITLSSFAWAHFTDNKYYELCIANYLFTCSLINTIKSFNYIVKVTVNLSKFQFQSFKYFIVFVNVTPKTCRT